MIRPIGPRVLVEKQSDETRYTESGIALPSKPDDITARGKVLAVGDCLFRMNGEPDPRDIRVGEIVSYHKQNAVEVPDGFIVDLVSIFGVA